MDILLIASALAIAVIVVPFAVIVIGIHHQERAGSLTDRPGACATIAAKVLALRADAAADSSAALRQVQARPRQAERPAHTQPGRHAASAHRQQQSASSAPPRTLVVGTRP